MKITRTINHKKRSFTLTKDELFDAYYEQQNKFDIEDVKTKFENMEKEDFAEYGMTKTKAKPLIEQIAYHKRRNINKYGMDWEDALDEAIEYVFRYEQELAADSF